MSPHPEINMTSPKEHHYRLPNRLVLSIAGGLASAFQCSYYIAMALPPAEDTPEEILRTEIILEARSPLDGKPLTASEYIELQEDLAAPDEPPTLNTETQHLIFLLQIRKFLNIVSPVQVL